jgi:Family of unknown function (DUF695)
VTDAGIEAFWTWWPEASARITAAIADGKLDEALIAEVTAKVQAIHAKLTWELGPGGTAKHALCLSAGGDPELRRLTERWFRAAPAADAVWEFHPARRPAPGLTGAKLQIAEHTVPLDEMRFTVTVDPNRELMNVASFHPAFAAMPDDMRGMVTFLILDRILGEDTVQRWLGGIGTSVEPLQQGAPFAMLTEAVGLLSGGATGERFTSLRGQTPDGQPMFATINLALKRIDHLACDTLLSVDVAVFDPAPDGTLDDEEADALDDIEDELEEMVTGDAVYFGCETVHGRRALHWFVAPDHPIRPALEAWATRHGDREVRLTWAPDPRWATADRFR